jgi:hypothetical protein
VLIGLAGLFAAIAWHLRGRAQTRAAVRAGYFDAVAPEFSKLRQAVAETGFPRLSGVWQGDTFDLQAVPDTLTFRKLPALWLLVTLPAPLPLRGTLDMLLRPMGTEPFTHFMQLPTQIATPSGLPPEAVLRCDDPTALPAADLVARHVAGLDKTRLKELVISPKGLRIVWLMEEADRTRYLIFRDAEMGTTALPPAQLRPLLAALQALREDLLETA